MSLYKDLHHRLVDRAVAEAKETLGSLDPDHEDFWGGLKSYLGSTHGTGSPGFLGDMVDDVADQIVARVTAGLSKTELRLLWLGTYDADRFVPEEEEGELGDLMLPDEEGVFPYEGRLREHVESDIRGALYGRAYNEWDEERTRP